jgi:2-methylcitrate dehydratase PrpD
MANSRSAEYTVSEALAHWIAGLRWEDLPVEVTRMAKRVVLDTLGCALQGRTTPEAARLRQVREDLGS